MRKSLPSAGTGADPGIQAVSLQVTFHPPGSRMPLLFARPHLHSFHQTAPPIHHRKDERLNWSGWLTVYLQLWSPISCRRSAGQVKFARLTFYHCAMQPTHMWLVETNTLLKTYVICFEPNRVLLLHNILIWDVLQHTTFSTFPTPDIGDGKEVDSNRFATPNRINLHHQIKVIISNSVQSMVSYRLSTHIDSTQSCMLHLTRSY